MMAISAHEQISRAIEDAAERFGSGQVSIESWPQIWADATCGFPGAGGQALTEAQTVIVQSKDDPYGNILVYHRGKYAYTVKCPGEAFWIRVSLRRLPGAIETEAIKQLERYHSGEKTS